MDLLTSCKDKLAHFRVKELKDVLTQLGLSKQGKKQDLVDRILAILSDEQVSVMWAKKNSVGKEEVAKLVDGIYRKMQVSGATDLASKSQVVSDSSNVKLKEEIEDTYQMKIRCPCGSSLQTETMIQCENRRCRTWQHVSCVVVPEKPMEGGVPPIPPETFYCELCRLSRADPFLVTMANPLYPAKLAITSVPVDGTSPIQRIEKTFQLTRADRDLLLKQEYDVQVWCMLLNDKVQFRMQWPQYADLQVNGIPVRCINRPGSQLLGANGRDDGPIITPCSRDGINKIILTGCDARVFCLGVRLVNRRTFQQVLNVIPKEADGEVFDDALARVRRCVGGGTATENADSDSDLEVVADFIPVNLRCPMSGSRMKVAGRFKPCVHMGCFDLEVFVEMNQRSRKWQCPICLKNYSLEHVIIDPYFNQITSQLRTCGEEVTEIEVKPDGSWRAKAEGDRRNLGDLGRWHLPDGNLIESQDIEPKAKPGILKHVKQEGGSESHSGLKVGLKKNRNGLWEISKPEDMQTLPYENSVRENFENQIQDIIAMSSSATGSGKEGEDLSVNQDGDVNFDNSNNGFELETISPNFGPRYGFNGRNPPAPSGDAEVIVLSDSDGENEPLISSTSIHSNNHADASIVSFPGRPKGISDSCHDNHAVVNDGNSCLGLFNANDDEFGMDMWPLPSVNQGGPSFQLFGSDTDVSGSLVDMQHGSINCPSSINGYSLAADTGVGSCSLLPESSVDRLNAEINDGLVNNSLSFGGNDPSLQIFLPTRPSDASVEADTRHRPGVRNGIHTEDWISLSLGAGGDSAVANELSSGQPSQTKNSSLDSVADTASLLLGMNDGVSMKSSKERSNGPSSRERSDGPFNFPRQRRSVRPRLYLSIDSDTE
ncbi:E3 SUMO-protein ligase SIZ1-like isoform X2 [Nicotiana tomentosiformis]|uniref:E3 SUMO-protein ligase SIZ1-like isoform X2 n=1 Tax=Nicotiana tomentosiformis TaxID=4098 RepID=UPI00051BCA98|nr:E3 SUMO-protein ligase SIZ1-like isoform X2 [Nicotiana tomentosiformis]XP_016513645.1 PREDICTED: E3 SUMO-protein ligase SIZ1-like isoform X2 [Nicotiana tabacum]